MKKLNKAFTFVELIVSITIITILTAIGFTSYVGYIGDSRDSQRKSDLAQVSSSLKVYKQKRGYYGNPGNSVNITYSGTIVAIQGKLNRNVHIDSLEKLPLDPANSNPYSYSITNNKQEFELVTTLENEDDPIALLTGNYKSVSKNILPTITLASGSTNDLEIKSGSIAGNQNRKLFIFDQNQHNLIYDFETGSPFSDGTDFEILLKEAEGNNTFWQNSDYRNCVEINEAGKMLLDPSTEEFEYQIINDNGILTNTGCTISNSQ